MLKTTKVVVPLERVTVLPLSVTVFGLLVPYSDQVFVIVSTCISWLLSVATPLKANVYISEVPTVYFQTYVEPFQELLTFVGVIVWGSIAS